jgi:hypothetical protein
MAAPTSVILRGSGESPPLVIAITDDRSHDHGGMFAIENIGS